MSITHIHLLNSLMLRVADFSFSFHCPTVTVLVPGNNNSAFTSVMSLDSKTDVKQNSFFRVLLSSLSIMDISIFNT